jgi:hypothetical protein
MRLYPDSYNSHLHPGRASEPSDTRAQPTYIPSYPCSPLYPQSVVSARCICTVPSYADYWIYRLG